jgi:hypothetical protein
MSRPRPGGTEEKRKRRFFEKKKQKTVAQMDRSGETATGPK